MSKRQIRILILAGLFLFFYLQRGILAPFVLALIFSYVLSPLVDLIHRQLGLPRLLSVIIIYLLFVIIVGLLLFALTSRLFEEVKEFRGESKNFIEEVRTQLGSFPGWLQLLVYESIKSLQNTTLIIPTKIIPYLSGAVSQIINVILFLCATFYFLKDGHKFSAALKKIFIETTSERMTEVYEKLIHVFSLYLRGQLFLVALMSTLTFVALSVLGVKFSLLLGVFTGFAEIVPIVGPMVATIVGVAVALVDGRSIFGLNLVGEGVVVALTYFILRQFEDIVVIPTVMGKIVRTHPLLVMFAVLAGGHIGGIWGLFLAVPVLAAARIIFEYFW